MSGRSSRYPFTASQWQELEHQALIFKYMASSMPIPSELILHMRRSYLLDSMTTTPTLAFAPQPSCKLPQSIFQLLMVALVHMIHVSFIFSLLVSFCIDVEKWNLGVSCDSGVELLPDGVWQEGRGPRTRQVQENRWEEVEVRQRGLPSLQVLREAHA